MRYRKNQGIEQPTHHELNKSASFSYVNPKTEVRNSQTPNRITYPDRSQANLAGIAAANAVGHHSPDHNRSATIHLNHVPNENNSSRQLTTPISIARMNSEIPQYY